MVSERFGQEDRLEFSGVLSRAAFNFNEIIEAVGFSPLQMQMPRKFSFIESIKKDGKTI